MRATWTIGRIRGAPIVLHWSLPLGAFFFGRFTWAPAFWLAFALIILFHELGHALVVRRTGHTIVHVLVHGLGGECAWNGDPTRIQRAAIAWGGVWAQLLLAAIAFPVLWFAPPSGAFLYQVVAAFTWSNLYLAAFNLLPIPGFDGKEAWKLPGLLMARWRRPKPALRPRVVSAKSAKVLPFSSRAAEKHVYPVEDDGPLSAEAKRIVEEAAEIARRAARDKSDREKDN